MLENILCIHIFQLVYYAKLEIILPKRYRLSCKEGLTSIMEIWIRASSPTVNETYKTLDLSVCQSVLVIVCSNDFLFDFCHVSALMITELNQNVHIESGFLIEEFNFFVNKETKQLQLIGRTDHK